jgi:hypothetical protein
VRQGDFEPTAYSEDSSANAVYLFNGGYTNFVRNKDDNFDIQFTHFSRIRLLKENSFSDAAVLEIPLVISTFYQQKLIKFAAQTGVAINPIACQLIHMAARTKNSETIRQPEALPSHGCRDDPYLQASQRR